MPTSAPTPTPTTCGQPSPTCKQSEWEHPGARGQSAPPTPGDRRRCPVVRRRRAVQVVTRATGVGARAPPPSFQVPFEDTWRVNGSARATTVQPGRAHISGQRE